MTPPPRGAQAVADLNCASAAWPSKPRALVLGFVDSSRVLELMHLAGASPTSIQSRARSRALAFSLSLSFSPSLSLSLSLSLCARAAA